MLYNFIEPKPIDDGLFLYPKDARMASFFLVPSSNKIDLYIVEAECKNICIYVLNA